MSFTTCEISGAEIVISDAEKRIRQRFNIPLPKVISSERLRRLSAMINPGLFRLARCSLTNDRVYSIHSARASYPIVSEKVWRESPPSSFSLDFDVELSLWDSLAALWQVVPRPATFNLNGDNSLAVNLARNTSHSLYSFNVADSDQVLYSSGIQNSRVVLDSLFCREIEQCYECIFCSRSSRLRWCEGCQGSTECWFSFNLEDCEYCLFCSDLKGKSYHVFNEPVSKEGFKEALREWRVSSAMGAALAFERYSRLWEQCAVSYLSENCFHLFECDDSYGCADADCISSCVDILLAGGGVHESAQSAGVFNSAQGIRNSIYCQGKVAELDYCAYCEESDHLIGCIGLRGASYCIYNKQYEPLEFERIRRELQCRLDWGIMLPTLFSELPYNLSYASILMPLGQAQAEGLGFTWDQTLEERAYNLAIKEGQQNKQIDEVPDTTAELSPAEIESQVFLCELTAQPFRISALELECYRELGVPPPKRAYPERQAGRYKRVPPRKLIHRALADGRMVQTCYPKSWLQPIK